MACEFYYIGIYTEIYIVQEHEISFLDLFMYMSNSHYLFLQEYIYIYIQGGIILSYSVTGEVVDEQCATVIVNSRSLVFVPCDGAVINM